MKLTKKDALRRRHLRVRKKVSGTPQRPRVAVRKSLRHLYLVVIDDSPETGSRTMATFSTASKETAGKHMANVAQASELGKRTGAELKSRGIGEIVFDRGGYRYHGRVKAIAEAMREAGVTF